MFVGTIASMNLVHTLANAHQVNIAVIVLKAILALANVVHRVLESRVMTLISTAHQVNFAVV